MARDRKRCSASLPDDLLHYVLAKVPYGPGLAPIPLISKALRPTTKRVVRDTRIGAIADFESRARFREGCVNIQTAVEWTVTNARGYDDLFRRYVEMVSFSSVVDSYLPVDTLDLLADHFGWSVLEVEYCFCGDNLEDVEGNVPCRAYLRTNDASVKVVLAGHVIDDIRDFVIGQLDPLGKEGFTGRIRSGAGAALVWTSCVVATCRD